MPNQYWSDKKVLGELLQEPTQVPDFQRSYSWETPFVETFWQDVLAFSSCFPGDTFKDQEYFLGPVVMVTQSAQPRKVLDGQQRLATTTILLAVMRDVLKRLGKTDSAQRIQENYIAGYNDFAKAQIYHLVLNQYDKEFFRLEVQEQRDSVTYIAPMPEMESHKLIRKARSYFFEQLGRKGSEFGENTSGYIDWLIRIKEIVTKHISVVFVTSEDEDNASQVFETLNDRGIGLSAPDLLRNLLLSRSRPEQRDTVVGYWRDVLQIEEKAGVENFLRHYWLSREGDVKARSLYREIKIKILADNIESLSFSRDLQNEASIYERIVTADDEDEELKNLLEGVAMVGVKSSLPLILSAYAVGDLNQKRSLLRDLLTLNVRYSVIGGLENSKLETFLFASARKLRNDGDFADFKQRIRSFSPNDAQFLNDFRTAEITKTSAAKYILREIEYKKRPTEELQVRSLSVNLEHIYSQNPAVTRLPNHDVVVNKIGNLTLLARRINTGLKNADFSEKKPAYQVSDFLITREIASNNNWTDETITRRQEDLANIASEIWKFE